MHDERSEKNVVLAETSGIEMFEPVAHEFMRAIIHLEPGEYRAHG